MRWSISPPSSAIRPARRSPSSPRTHHLGRVPEPVRNMRAATAWAVSSSPRPAATTARWRPGTILDEEAPLRPVSLYAELKVGSRAPARALHSGRLHHPAVRHRLRPLPPSALRSDGQRVRSRCPAQGRAGDLRAGVLATLLPRARHRVRCRPWSSSRTAERVAGKVFNVGANEENYQKRDDRGSDRRADAGSTHATWSGTRTHATTGWTSTGSPPSGSSPGCACADGIREVADAIARRPDRRSVRDPIQQLVARGRHDPAERAGPAVGANSSTSADCLTSAGSLRTASTCGEMEEVLAEYLGVKHVVACNCGHLGDPRLADAGRRPAGRRGHRAHGDVHRPGQRGSLRACLAGLRRLRRVLQHGRRAACGASWPRGASCATGS